MSALSRAARDSRPYLFAALIAAAPAAALACGGFWDPAPPLLDAYPERLPGKTIREILTETSLPPAADAATLDQLQAEVAAIGADLTTKPKEELLTRIQAALERNRQGEYRKRFANCLYDFRDLLTAPGEPAPATEIADYAAWRVSVMDNDTGHFTRGPREEDRWSLTGEQMAAVLRNHENFLAFSQRITRDPAKDAHPTLKPHWLVQYGAQSFQARDFAKAAATFESVVAQFPQHPRAEAAQLMLARARTEEWRAAKQADEPGWGELRRRAESEWEAYRSRYPQGRYIHEIDGWIGGLSTGNEAMSAYLRQMDVRDHPEVVARAVREYERVLRELDINDMKRQDRFTWGPPSLPYAEIAKRPMATLATVYHFLDSESRHDFDRLLNVAEMPENDVAEVYLNPMLRLRRVGALALPVLAREVAAQKAAYAAAGWQPRYLAILAWAASEAGDHVEAVRVCDLAGPALEQSDDLLFARSVAQQRAGNLAGAAAGYRLLRERFPASPFNRETQFRLATVLRDQKEAGQAVVELLRLETIGGGGYEAEPSPVPSLHLSSEVAQWVDTLLQFAPLEELERGLPAAGEDADTIERLHAMLRQRYLARQDFAAALRHAEAAPEGWADAVKELRDLKARAKKAKGATKRAEAYLALAEAWSAARGNLTLPSTEDRGDYGNEGYIADAQRLANARIAGYDPAAATAELESRDELRHAYNAYRQAAEQNAAPAAGALWKANDALRRLSELTPWAARRAFEGNAAATSKALHEELRRRYPDSPEAKALSVWWTFPAPAEADWLPGDHSNWNVELQIAAWFRGQVLERWRTEDYGEIGDFEDRLKALAEAPEPWDAPRLKERVETLRKEYLPHFISAEGASLMNDLDDLALFLSEPALTPEMIRAYLNVRVLEAAPQPDLPGMALVGDYLAFIRLVREDGGRPMSARMTEFLEHYPQSKKREAAQARLAISLARESRHRPRVVGSDWPDAPKIGGYKEMVDTRDEEVTDRAPVFAALDTYDREFPGGRYAADIRLWRGAVELDARQWKPALDHLTALLDDPTKRDLHLDAALNLATLYMALLDAPESRPALISALRDTPAAQKRLRQFMESPTLGARLRCLDGYLVENGALTPPAF